MATRKKSGSIWTPLLIALAGLGFYIFNDLKAKPTPDPTTPEPTPEPTPQPTPKPQTQQQTTSIPKQKAINLQNLILRRFVQLGRENELGKNFVDGSFGDRSNVALQKLRPKTYQTSGRVTSQNIDFYISNLTLDVEKAAKDEKEMKTKQTTQKANIDLANSLLKYVQTPGKELRLLNDVTATKTQFDVARNTYLNLNDTRKFFKNSRFGKDRLVNRNDGYIGIKVDEFRYFVPASQFITQL